MSIMESLASWRLTFLVTRVHAIRAFGLPQTVGFFKFMKSFLLTHMIVSLLRYSNVVEK